MEVPTPQMPRSPLAILREDAEHLRRCLSDLSNDLEAYTFGELRERLREAASAAADVMDAVVDMVEAG